MQLSVKGTDTQLPKEKSTLQQQASVSYSATKHILAKDSPYKKTLAEYGVSPQPSGSTISHALAAPEVALPYDPMFD